MDSGGDGDGGDDSCGGEANGRLHHCEEPTVLVMEDGATATLYSAQDGSTLVEGPDGTTTTVLSSPTMSSSSICFEANVLSHDLQPVVMEGRGTTIDDATNAVGDGVPCSIGSLTNDIGGDVFATVNNKSTFAPILSASSSSSAPSLKAGSVAIVVKGVGKVHNTEKLLNSFPSLSRVHSPTDLKVSSLLNSGYGTNSISKNTSAGHSLCINSNSISRTYGNKNHTKRHLMKPSLLSAAAANSAIAVSKCSARSSNSITIPSLLTSARRSSAMNATNTSSVKLEHAFSSSPKLTLAIVPNERQNNSIINTNVSNQSNHRVNTLLVSTDVHSSVGMSSGNDFRVCQNEAISSARGKQQKQTILATLPTLTEGGVTSTKVSHVPRPLHSLDHHLQTVVDSNTDPMTHNNIEKTLNSSTPFIFKRGFSPKLISDNKPRGTSIAKNNLDVNENGVVQAKPILFQRNSSMLSNNNDVTALSLSSSITSSKSSKPYAKNVLLKIPTLLPFPQHQNQQSLTSTSMCIEEATVTTAVYEAGAATAIVDSCSGVATLVEGAEVVRSLAVSYATPIMHQVFLQSSPSFSSSSVYPSFSGSTITVPSMISLEEPVKFEPGATSAQQTLHPEAPMPRLMLPTDQCVIKTEQQQDNANDDGYTAVVPAVALTLEKVGVA